MWRFIFCAGVLALALTAAIHAKPNGKKDTDGSQTYILYQEDHEARAKALAAVCGDKYCEPITKGAKGIKAPTAITKLTVWGHGDQVKFCNLSATEFTNFILAWKRLNPKLKTIEILTCDARHNAMANRFGPFSNRVADNVSKKHRDLTIKALPIGQRKGDSSILWADPSSGKETFCYITAPNQTVLEEANKALLAMYKKEGDDLSVAANKLTPVKNRKFAGASQVTYNYGPLKLIRSHLQVVKK
jgi:hypothetical protein